MYTKDQIDLAKQLLNEIQEESNKSDIWNFPNNVAIRIYGYIIQRLEKIIGGQE